MRNHSRKGTHSLKDGVLPSELPGLSETAVSIRIPRWSSPDPGAALRQPAGAHGQDRSRNAAPGDPDRDGTADSPEAAAWRRKGREMAEKFRHRYNYTEAGRKTRPVPPQSRIRPHIRGSPAGRKSALPVQPWVFPPSIGERGPDFPRPRSSRRSGAGPPAAPSSPFFRLRRNTPPLNFTGFIQSAAGRRLPAASCHGPVSGGNLRHDFRFCLKKPPFHAEPGREARIVSSAAPGRCRSSPRAGPHITPVPLPRMGGSGRQPFPCCVEGPRTV